MTRGVGWLEQQPGLIAEPSLSLGPAQNYNLILYSETLENEEHTKGKQRKEVVQIRTESNATKARKTTESMLMSV